MKNIYLFYGTNSEALLDFQDNLAKKFLKADFDNFSYLKLNMMNTTIEELIYECQSSGFFSSKKVIVAENAIFLENKPKKSKVSHDTDKLLQYIDNFNNDVVVIFRCNNIDKRKKIVKSILKIGEAKEFNDFKEKELENFVISYLQENNIKIKREVAKFSIIYSNQNFAGIKRELEKLILFVDEKKVVEKEDIETLVTKSLEYDVFEFSSSLFKKDYVKMSKILEALRLKGEEPIHLLGLISGQLRLFYKVKVLLNEHYNQKDIASKLGVHPYRVQLAAEIVYNYSIKQLMECLNLCCEADFNLKTQYIDKYITLDLFLNKLIEKLK